MRTGSGADASGCGGFAVGNTVSGVMGVGTVDAGNTVSGVSDAVGVGADDTTSGVGSDAASFSFVPKTNSSIALPSGSEILNTVM
jgi:hypothetical protein